MRRIDGRYERLTSTGVALGMFEGSTFGAARTTVRPGELLVLYSDGITEAENPIGQPFEEPGLEQVSTPTPPGRRLSWPRRSWRRSNGTPSLHVSSTI